MFDAERFSANLGGQCQNLGIADLNPHELKLSAGCSIPRAYAFAELAIAQAHAAEEFGDEIAARDYRDAAFLFKQIVGKANVTEIPLRPRHK